MSYSLKTFIQNNYPDSSPSKILDDLSQVVVIQRELTKAGLVTIFAFNPQLELRLKSFVDNQPASDSPAIQVWAIAKMALRLVEIPGIDSVLPDLASQAIAALRSAELITEEELTILQENTSEQISKGEQLLGYLPTLDQITQALALQWPD